MLQLAAAAQRVHRRGRYAEALGDGAHGELDLSEAGSEHGLDRGTKGGTKLRATCCGLLRSVRVGLVAQCSSCGPLRPRAARCGRCSSPSQAEGRRFESGFPLQSEPDGIAAKQASNPPPSGSSNLLNSECAAGSTELAVRDFGRLAACGAGGRVARTTLIRFLPPRGGNRRRARATYARSTDASFRKPTKSVSASMCICPRVPRA